MDANHDGRITSEEITAYGHLQARQKKEDEFNLKKATDMSVFYGNEDSSSSSDAYSILSYKYSKNTEQ